MVIFIFILALISFYGYVYTNKRPYRYVFKSRFDDLIPLVPVFVVPYISLYPLMVLSFTILFRDPIYIDFLTCVLITNVFATVFWYFFPNGIKRTTLSQPGIFSNLINKFYTNDGDTNGFPSGHVYLSGICSFYLLRIYPDYLLFIALMFITISISTVFIKQHYLIDIVGGLLFAAIGIISADVINNIGA